MQYQIRTKVVTTVDVEFNRILIGSSFSEKIHPYVKHCTLTAYGHETTVSLTPHDNTDMEYLLWLIDKFAKEAVGEVG